MTDIVSSRVAAPAGANNLHTGEAAKRRLRARYAAERRFKWFGAGAVAVSALFLVVLLSTIVREALPAFTMSTLTLPVDLSAAKVDPADPASSAWDTIVQEALLQKFPEAKSRQERRLARGLISTGSGTLLRGEVMKGGVTPG